MIMGGTRKRICNLTVRLQLYTSHSYYKRGLTMEEIYRSERGCFMGRANEFRGWNKLDPSNEIVVGF